MTDAVNHLLLGPDANRRYAVKNNLTLIESYGRLMDKLPEVIEWTFNLPVNELTIALCVEYNLHRPREQVMPFLDAFADGILQLSKTDYIKKNNFCLRPFGELDVFHKVRGKDAYIFDEMIKETETRDGKRINLALAYNQDKEILRAIERCRKDNLEPTFANMESRWSIPPVDLMLRVGYPDGFVKATQFWPGIEQTRMKSHPKTLQELTQEEYTGMINEYLNLVDSYDKLK